MAPIQFTYPQKRVGILEVVAYQSLPAVTGFDQCSETLPHHLAPVVSGLMV